MESVYRDAQSSDEVGALLHLAHSIGNEVPTEAPDPPQADPRNAERDRIIAEGGDPVFHVGGLNGGGWVDHGRRPAEPDDVTSHRAVGCVGRPV